MNNYLSNIAARALNQAPTVRLVCVEDSIPGRRQTNRPLIDCSSRHRNRSIQSGLSRIILPLLPRINGRMNAFTRPSIRTKTSRTLCRLHIEKRKQPPLYETTLLYRCHRRRLFKWRLRPPRSRRHNLRGQSPLILFRRSHRVSSAMRPQRALTNAVHSRPAPTRRGRLISAR